MFVNGAQITSFSVDDTISQNIEMKMWGSTSQHTFVGAMKGSSVENEFDGYMAEINFLDGVKKSKGEQCSPFLFAKNQNLFSIAYRSCFSYNGNFYLPRISHFILNLF